MPIDHLHKFLIAPQAHKLSLQFRFWLGLSLAFAASYSLLGLQQAFSHKYVIQDDARQHVFWMQRFIDPGLFPDDLITDYFQAVAPPGYTALYQWFASIGIDPLLLSKFLPPVLGLIATAYCFGCVMQILPVPFTGFVATLLLNQNLWLKDDLASGTPRAFVYPLLLAFMYYLMQRSLLQVCGLIALQGLFYPQFVFIYAVILTLRLLNWQHWRVRLSRDRRDYWVWAIGLGVAGLVMLPYVLKNSEFGPVITATQARLLPELSSGRSSFFIQDPWEFWLFGQRSGLLPLEWNDLPYEYFLFMFGIGLSLLLILRFPRRFPLVAWISDNIAVLPQLALASLLMFFTAHAFLFKLHLPSRYTQHSLRILMAISAAIALTVILDAIFSACRQPDKPYRKQRQFLAIATTALLGAVILTFPASEEEFPKVSYKIGRAETLYEFFQQQPKDILIASLTAEGGNLPTFAQRSVLTARQYAIPYHIGYYNQIRQRTIDLINAQYSPNLKQVQNFIQKYGIDFWLLEKTAFIPEYLTENSKHANRVWIRQHQPATNEALAQLQRGMTPALSGVMNQCSAFETQELLVLQANCVMNASKP